MITKRHELKQKDEEKMHIRVRWPALATRRVNCVPVQLLRANKMNFFHLLRFHFFHLLHVYNINLQVRFLQQCQCLKYDSTWTDETPMAHKQACLRTNIAWRPLCQMRREWLDNQFLFQFSITFLGIYIKMLHLTLSAMCIYFTFIYNIGCRSDKCW